MSPTLSKNYSRRVSKAVLSSSRKWKIDWRVIVSILRQESSFRADPDNCLKKSCKDFGIGQINFKTWGKTLGLSKKLLVKNIEYNIDTTAHILSIVKKGHESDKYWYSRFHSFTKSHRYIYLSYVKPIHTRVNKFAMNNYYE